MTGNCFASHVTDITKTFLWHNYLIKDGSCNGGVHVDQAFLFEQRRKRTDGRCEPLKIIFWIISLSKRCFEVNDLVISEFFHECNRGQFWIKIVLRNSPLFTNQIVPQESWDAIVQFRHSWSNVQLAYKHFAMRVEK